MRSCVDSIFVPGLEVRELTPADTPLWERYVAESPKATFYHRIEWKKIIEKSFAHRTYYLMAFEGGGVVGILPIVHIRSLLFGSIFCSMPFLNFAGVCGDREDVERALITHAQLILRRSNGDYLELRHLEKSPLDILAKSHKVSMTLELDPDPEVLWKRFSSKHRTTIRRAAKNGLRIKKGNTDLVGEFYEVMCRGWSDLGTPLYNISFFCNILEAMGDSIEIYIVTYQERAIAAAFNGLFKGTVEGMWLSSLPEYSRLQPGYFLYWEMIRQACDAGFKEYHLGRSSVESGGEIFKKKWNAVPKQLYWEYILNRSTEVPELNVQNPRYQMAIRLWRRLPIPVTKVLGPVLAKNIP